MFHHRGFSLVSLHHRTVKFITSKPILNGRQLYSSRIPRFLARGLKRDGVNFSTRQSPPGNSSRWSAANKNTVTYAIALAVAVGGLSYAAVPLYRLFCQASGFGGTTIKVEANEKVENMEPIREREIIIRFVCVFTHRVWLGNFILN